MNTASAELTALLDSGAAQEGWLVVLTDGIFDSDVPAAGLQEDLKQKADIFTGSGKEDCEGEGCRRRKYDDLEHIDFCR